MVGRPLDVVLGCGAAIPRSKLGEIAAAVFCGASFLEGLLLGFGLTCWMVWLVLALAVDAGCGVTFPISKLSCFLFLSLSWSTFFLWALKSIFFSLFNFNFIFKQAEAELGQAQFQLS